MLKDMMPLTNQYKSLKNYTHDELMEFLKNNENEDTRVLACICSEILRRELLPEAPR